MLRKSIGRLHKHFALNLCNLHKTGGWKWAYCMIPCLITQSAALRIAAGEGSVIQAAWWWRVFPIVYSFKRMSRRNTTVFSEKDFRAARYAIEWLKLFVKIKNSWISNAYMIILYITCTKLSKKWSNQHENNTCDSCRRNRLPIWRRH